MAASVRQSEGGDKRPGHAAGTRAASGKESRLASARLFSRAPGSPQVCYRDPVRARLTAFVVGRPILSAALAVALTIVVARLANHLYPRTHLPIVPGMRIHDDVLGITWLYRTTAPTFGATGAGGLRERIHARMRRDARWVPTRRTRPRASAAGITQ